VLITVKNAPTKPTARLVILTFSSATQTTIMPVMVANQVTAKPAPTKPHAKPVTQDLPSTPQPEPAMLMQFQLHALSDAPVLVAMPPPVHHVILLLAMPQFPTRTNAKNVHQVAPHVHSLDKPQPVMSVKIPLPESTEPL
jgi:hypothetical protein